MKKRISILTLFCAFATAGLVAQGADFWLCTTAPCTIEEPVFGGDRSPLEFKTPNSSGGYYYSGYDTAACGVSQISVTPGQSGFDRIWMQKEDPAGMRFKGWYALATSSISDSAPHVDKATQLLTTNKELEWNDVEGAPTWNPGSLPYPFVVAKYVKIYEIKTVVSPEGAGTAKGAGTYEKDASVKLQATENSGYEFVKWTLSGVEKSTDATYNTTATVNATYTAVFVGKTYSVSFNFQQGTGSMATVSAVFNDPMPKLGAEDLPRRFGWTFAGYFDQQNGNGTQYYAADGTSAHVWNKTGGATLYAKWIPNQYDFIIEFPKAGGTASVFYRIGQSEDWIEVTASVTNKVDCGETCYAYDTAADGYVPQYAKEECWSGTMTGNGLTFAPQPSIEGYLLTIDPNGGVYGGRTDPTTLNLRLKEGTDNNNQVAVSTKDDGVFMGYYDRNNEKVYDSSGKWVQGTYWNEQGKFQGRDNLLVKAGWGKTYQIQVSCDPAVGEVAGGGTYEENAAVTLTATPNDGYSFCCWTNSATGLSTNANPWTFAATANADYMATFTGNVYTVKFQNSGQKKAPTKQVTFGEQYGELPIFTDDELILEGWYTKDEGAGTKILSTTFVTTPNNHDLYANWTEKTEFTGTFVDPSGTNKTVVVEGLTKGQPVPDDKTPKFAREGYWFAGWNPELPVTVTGDFTTYAQWISLASILDCEGALWFAAEDNSLWVVDSSDKKLGGASLRADGPRGDGGSGRLVASVMEAGTMTFWWKGDTGTTLSVKSEKDEFFGTFAGSGGMDWTLCTVTIANDAGSSVIFYCSGTEFNNRCSVDGFTWTPGVVPQEHTIIVDAGEHGLATGGGTVNVDADVTLTATADPGYAFCCWTNDTGFATNENPWAFTVVEDATYTAIFTARVYRVTLNPSGGTGGEAEVWATFGEEMPTLESLPQLEHNDFLGYFDASTDRKKYYNIDGTSAATWDKTADSELFAHWNEEGKVAVTVAANNATRGTVSGGGSYYPGDEVTISATPNAGYAFEKWSDGSVESNHEIKVPAEATTYIATFTACVYRVTFDANGGETPSPQTMDVTFGEPYGMLATTTRNGYAFAGWWTAASGGTEVKAESVVTITADQTLYAQWTQDLGPYSKALDCSNLKFELSQDGWFVCNETPHKGNSCLRSETSEAELTTTITESGTLTFWWRGVSENRRHELLVVTNNATAITNKLIGASADWAEVKDLKIVASTTNPVELKFVCSAKYFDGYFAIDDVTWTPDGGGEPTPGDPDAVTISSAAVANGKFSLSFKSDAKFDYNLLTNANLLIDGWGIMETQVGDGNILTFEPLIIEGQPQLFYKVETIQRK